MRRARFRMMNWRWPERIHWKNLNQKQRLGVAVAAGFLLLLVMFLWPTPSVTAPGVVATQTMRFSAEHGLTVTDIYVRPGDHVTAGDPLYVTVSDVAAGELATDEAERARIDARIATLTSDTPELDPDLADDNKELELSLAALAKLEAERISLDDRVALVAIERRLAETEARVDALLERHRRSQTQLEEVRRLRALDAALVADERAAADRESVRYEELQAAVRAKQELETEAEQVAITTEQRRHAIGTDIDTTAERIAGLETRLEERGGQLLTELHARRQAVSVRIDTLLKSAGAHQKVAPAAGVVSTLTVADGATVAAGHDILELTLSDRLLVEVYVPVEQRSVLNKTRRAVITTADGTQLDADIANRGSLATTIPGVIRDTLASEDNRALLVLVEPQNPGTLVPGEAVSVTLRY